MCAGICRVGGRDRFFHCSTCGCCYDKELQDNHVCVENSMRQNCPVRPALCTNAALHFEPFCLSSCPALQAALQFESATARFEWPASNSLGLHLSPQASSIMAACVVCAGVTACIWAVLACFWFQGYITLWLLTLVVLDAGALAAFMTYICGAETCVRAEMVIWGNI